jgi:quercetin dioxygenase-like cupin family protein
MANPGLESWQTEKLPWEELVNEVTGKTFHRKFLMQDPDTGMEVMIVRYPAGTVTPWHRHSCGHGLYVIEGRLRSHAGVHEPGDFVWYPQGNVGEHGATAEGPVTLLLITNKPFGIEYVAAAAGQA